jgi:hypothetical protein
VKVIIAGGRDFWDCAVCDNAIERSGFKITEIVSGGAQGADALGVQWARLHGIPMRHFPAQWKEHGRAAGPIRNRKMAEYADALIALPGGRGTANMVAEARKRGLLVYEAKDG